ncbi:hypothetical protein BPOR_0955g00010 [Botrytis porri]|uniref:ABM domain-containing protein n=1 Tax=Botrytis porri TaxID=87229 RepID=A0A4Z1K954_9HELO|nr:hypothetical protein BPOR_0955g00010 [Botrytis porri]
MSEKFHACVIIYPAPGKEARKLLNGLATRVKEDEPGALTRDIGENKAALDAHFATPAFITIVTGKFPNEDLLAQPLDMMKVEPFEGFASC